MLRFIAHPIDTIEDDFNGVKNFFTHPIDTRENKGKNTLTAVEHPIDTVKNTVAGDLIQPITDIKDEIVKGKDWLSTEFQKIEDGVVKGFNEFESGVEYGWNNVVAPLFIDLWTLLKFSIEILNWSIEHRYLLLGVGVAYGGMKFINEVKQTVKSD